MEKGQHYFRCWPFFSDSWYATIKSMAASSLINNVFSDELKMNITEMTDEEILALAHPMWADLVKYSNEQNYGAFTRNFSTAMKMGANEIEMGKQFARSDLAKNLSTNYQYLGIIRRGEYVTVLYKQPSTKDKGEWLGRLVLGYEKGVVKIFGCTLF